MNLMQNGCQNSVWTCRPVRSFTAWIYPPGALEYVTTFRFKIIIFDELKKPSMDKDLLESLRRSLGLVYFDENATWLWHLNHEKRVTWVEKYSLWTRDIAYIYIYIYIERERLLSREKYVCLICTYDTSFTSNVERGVQMSVRAAEKLSRLSLISNNAISLLIFVRFFTIPFHFTLNPCYV